MKSNIKRSKKLKKETSTDPETVIMEMEWDANANEYRCQCCGACKTCHIQVGCIIICILYIIYAVANIINAAVLLNGLSPSVPSEDNTDVYPSVTPVAVKGTIAYLSLLFIAYPLAVIVTAIGVFAAIAMVKPRWVLPYIVTLGVGLIVCAIASIMNILSVTGAVNSPAWPSVKQNVKFQRKIFGPLAASMEQSTGPNVSAASWSYVAGFVLISAFVVYCIYLHVKLYQYLKYKQSYRCLKNTNTVSMPRDRKSVV